jgi:hypothetical protein
MPMSIKNAEVEQLAEELGRLTRTSKTEVIRQALLEKKRRLMLEGAADLAAIRAARAARMQAYLTERVWPVVPEDASRRWTKEEEESFLGYGSNGA